MIASLKRGLIVGLHTTWSLGKIIFPITLIMTLIQFTPLLDWVSVQISPFMRLLGLSGSAAVPLVIGSFLNIYAAIGAILTLDITVKEVFILAVMLSFCHNVIIESAVAVRVGLKMWVVIVVRVAIALLAGFMINLVWQGGSEMAKYGFVPEANEHATGWVEILLIGFQKAGIGILQLAVIVIPLMVGIQILKDLQWLQVFSRWMSPFTKILGMKENTSTTLAAGFLFGLAYGAGVMVQAVKEDGVSKKDVLLVFTFLIACHAVIEDTLIFIPLGIPVWPLLLIRFVTAVILTVSLAFLLKRHSYRSRKEATYEH